MSVRVPHPQTLAFGAAAMAAGHVGRGPGLSPSDASALESLEAINHRLANAGIKLHLSEVKGPVMDRLRRSRLLGDLTGRIFLSQDDAFATLVSSADDEAVEQRDDLWLARGLI